MKTIFIDSNFKCHTTNNGDMLSIETEFFDGKCDNYIEGYCYKPCGDGYSIFPWKNYSELDAAQRQYEQEQLIEAIYKLEQLNASYQEGINSI